MFKKQIVILILVLIQHFSYAQFTGGNQDGYQMKAWQNTLHVFSGGHQDGYSQKTYSNIISIFSGGNKDGYHSRESLNTFSVFSGGDEDGHSFEIYLNLNSIFSGGDQDGYHFREWDNTLNVFSGGNQDGYDVDAEIVTFIWIGVTNENWMNATNWSGNRVPHIYSEVIIPSGVAFYPHLSPGILSIGEDLNAGTFLCKNITIHENAEIVLGNESYIENYGKIENLGLIQSSNQNAGSFQNFYGAYIYVRGAGEINIE